MHNSNTKGIDSMFNELASTVKAVQSFDFVGETDIYATVTVDGDVMLPEFTMFYDAEELIKDIDMTVEGHEHVEVLFANYKRLDDKHATYQIGIRIKASGASHDKVWEKYSQSLNTLTVNVNGFLHDDEINDVYMYVQNPQVKSVTVEDVI